VSGPEIVVADGALGRVAHYADRHGWRDALIVMDANTEEAAGATVTAELEAAGVRARALRFLERAGLLANEEAVAKVRARLRVDEPDGVIAVGSGVITDIVRYSCHRESRDFVCVPTAASMDGYASGVAAMEFAGVKVTFPARAPRALGAAPAGLAAAPPALTRSGLGDLLAKATARVDWLATHLLYGEPFAAEVDARVLAPVRYAAGHPGAVLRGDRDAITRLLDGLLESGRAMATVGSSRPASGCEHQVSHFLDLLAARGVREHQPHGLQVGYATQWAMRLQRFAFAGGVPSLAAPRDPPLDGDAREWLGSAAPPLAEAMAEKQRFATEHAGRWPAAPEAWDEIRVRLADALAVFGPAAAALDAAGLPAEPSVLGLDPRTLRAAFRHARRLRARYTTLDFLAGQGALDAAIDAELPNVPP
jgi:glycerol-1-phosphate dehydrogenase [NAD(P)+]